MKAVVFDGELRVDDVSAPRCGAGEVLVRVTKAGICNTDIEITRGYIPGFKGILGHEFVGVVEEADDEGLAGRRVSAEINFACGRCVYCLSGLQRHCPNRTVLGIQNRNGALAEYVAVPRENVVLIPDEIPDSRALFIEPLAAALEIMEQLPIGPAHSVLLLGDGKLGQLVARVLASTGCRLTVVGKHAHKLALLADTGASTVMLGGFRAAKHDIVVEATGSPSAFGLAMSSVKPRGTVVLKSTYARGFSFNPSAIVVDEITIVGSRCGRFAHAIAFLQDTKPPLEKLISAEYDLDDAVGAFTMARSHTALKVVVKAGG